MLRPNPLNAGEFEAFIDFDSTVNDSSKCELLYALVVLFRGVNDVLLRVNSDGGITQAGVDICFICFFMIEY